MKGITITGNTTVKQVIEALEGLDPNSTFQVDDDNLVTIITEGFESPTIRTDVYGLETDSSILGFPFGKNEANTHKYLIDDNGYGEYVTIISDALNSAGPFTLAEECMDDEGVVSIVAFRLIDDDGNTIGIGILDDDDDIYTDGNYCFGVSDYNNVTDAIAALTVYTVGTCCYGSNACYVDTDGVAESGDFRLYNLIVELPNNAGEDTHYPAALVTDSAGIVRFFSMDEIPSAFSRREDDILERIDGISKEGNRWVAHFDQLPDDAILNTGYAVFYGDDDMLFDLSSFGGAVFAAVCSNDEDYMLSEDEDDDYDEDDEDD